MLPGIAPTSHFQMSNGYFEHQGTSSDVWSWFGCRLSETEIVLYLYVVNPLAGDGWMANGARACSGQQPPEICKISYLVKFKAVYGWRGLWGGNTGGAVGFLLLWCVRMRHGGTWLRLLYYIVMNLNDLNRTSGVSTSTWPPISGVPLCILLMRSISSATIIIISISYDPYRERNTSFINFAPNHSPYAVLQPPRELFRKPV